ncbi:MAG TPA: hypothetical protein VKU60_05920 [Chloroflexota bacterium]|nr:hypothetical protein [Chloroflexota bacterium]
MDVDEVPLTPVLAAGDAPLLEVAPVLAKPVLVAPEVELLVPEVELLVHDGFAAVVTGALPAGLKLETADADGEVLDVVAGALGRALLPAGGPELAGAAPWLEQAARASETAASVAKSDFKDMGTSA